MNSLFALGFGSVAGKDHLRMGRNNQDALYWMVVGDAIAIVVCDGCSGGVHSEVGAQIGAKVLVQAMQQTLSKRGLDANAGSPTEFLEEVQNLTLDSLKELLLRLGGDSIETIRDYLLFTILGAVISPTQTLVFSLGDGVILLNGQVLPFPTFVNNAPPYLAYRLLPRAIAQFQPEDLQLQIQVCLPTQQVNSLLIGTDGVHDLMAVAGQFLPGKTELVGAISQFWEGDRYFQNPDQIRRRLALINREIIKPDWENQQLIREGSLLPDDTTFVVIRRKRC
jgi:hypothetical protein